MMAINPNAAIGHDTIEFDEYVFSGCLIGNGKVLAVPDDAGRQESPGAAGERLFVEWLVDRPIVRQIHGGPLRIVKRFLFDTGRVSRPIGPTSIEGHCSAW